MIPVFFVAPFFRETTLRFIRAAVGLPGVRVSLVSQDPADRLPDDLRRGLARHERVDDGIDAQTLLDGMRRLMHHEGQPQRLLGTLEELQVPLGEIRDHLGIEGMGAEAAKNFRDKSRMKSVLRDAGLPCAMHRLVTTSEDAVAVARDIGYPIIVKPPQGSGARSTFRVDAEEPLIAAMRAMPPSPDRPTLLEEFVVGEEQSFDSICIDGRMVWWNVNHYEPGPLEVIEQPWIQWCVLSPREVDHPRYADIRDVAARALSVLGMQTGLSHMEWFRRPDGSIAISEVGARPPGAQFTTLISYGADFDMYEAWARLMVFGSFEAKPRPYAAGAAYLRGQGKGRVRDIEGLAEAQRELGPLVVEARLPKVDQTPSGTYEGDGYVILRSPDTETVRSGLRSLVRTVRVKLG